MRAFKTFVGHVCFYTQPTKGTKSTTDCRQVNTEKLTIPARNRQKLKKADKISLKNHEKTDNELYISGCAFSGDWGQEAGIGRRTAKHRTDIGGKSGRDRTGSRPKSGRDRTGSRPKSAGTESDRKTGQKRRFFEQKMVLSGLLGACQESVT